MGWFLPSGKKSKKRGQGKPSRKWAQNATRAAAGPASRWRWARRAAAVVAVAGLGVGAWLGYAPLRDHVAARAAHATAGDLRVRLNNVPPWMRPEQVQRIVDEVAYRAGPDPLDRAALADAVAYLEREAWVRAVNSVQRHDRGVIDVHATWRHPAALIGARDGFHLIDPDGVRLPGVYGYDQLEALGLTAITGVAAAPPAQGATWPGNDVQAGLALAKLLAGRPFADQVRAVDVSNYAGRADDAYPHISLITRDGMVRWGRAPGEAGIYEPDAPRKLAMIQRVAERYGGRIDANGQTVDVYLDTPLIHPTRRARYTSSP